MESFDEVIKQSLETFKSWKENKHPDDSMSDYKKLSEIYNSKKDTIDGQSWIWTTIYRDGVVPLIADKSSNVLYEALSDLISIQKEQKWDTLSFDEKIAYLNKISCGYTFSAEPDYWIELHRALDSGLGLREGELIQAIENYKTAISLKKQGDFAQAKIYFTRSLALDSSNAFVELLCGFNLKDYAFSAGMVDMRIPLLKDAEKHFQKAIKLSPYDAVCEEVYGILLKDWAMNMDDIKIFEFAKAHFERAIDLEPENAAIQQAFFWFYVDYEKALKKQQGITETGQRVIDDKATATRKAKTILAHYDLGDVLHAEEVMWGFINRTYLVETTKGMYVLKQCIGHNTLKEIESEYLLVKYLKSHGFPVADIFRHKEEKNKGIFIILDDEMYIISEYIEGSQILFDVIEGPKLVNMAKMLAKFHDIVSKYFPEEGCNFNRPGLDLVMSRLDNFKEIKASLDNRNIEFLSKAARIFIENYDYIMKQVSCIGERFSIEYYKQLPQLIVHGGYDSLNLKFKDDEVSGVFDWDNTRKEARIYDIIICMHRMHAFTSGSDINIDMVTNFVKAYQSEIPLFPAEIKAIPELFRLIFLEDMLEKLKDIEEVKNNTDRDKKLCICILFNVGCLKMRDRENWQKFTEEVMVL